MIIQLSLVKTIKVKVENILDYLAACFEGVIAQQSEVTALSGKPETKGIEYVLS